MFTKGMMDTIRGTAMSAQAQPPKPAGAVQRIAEAIKNKTVPSTTPAPRPAPPTAKTPVRPGVRSARGRSMNALFRSAPKRIY